MRPHYLETGAGRRSHLEVQAWLILTFILAALFQILILLSLISLSWQQISYTGCKPK